jgi:hypothetical protein
VQNYDEGKQKKAVSGAETIDLSSKEHAALPYPETASCVSSTKSFGVDLPTSTVRLQRWSSLMFDWTFTHSFDLRQHKWINPIQISTSLRASEPPSLRAPSDNRRSTIDDDLLENHQIGLIHSLNKILQQTRREGNLENSAVSKSPQQEK